MFKRIPIVIMLVLALLLFAAPVLAQETPPPVVTEGLSRVEIIFIGAMFVLVVLIVVAGVLLKSYADKLFAALPPWAEDIIIDLLRKVEAELDRIANETPNTIDNELVKELKQLLELLVARETREIAAESRKVGSATPIE